MVDVESHVFIQRSSGCPSFANTTDSTDTDTAAIITYARGSRVGGKSRLEFPLCVGFRNLQNIVRKIKRKKYDYDFMEVMACPSGCLNGGRGQIKLQPGQSAKNFIHARETIYMESVRVMDPFKNPHIRNRLYNERLELPGSKKAKEYIHAEYHPIVKSIT